MNWDQIEGKWKQSAGVVKQKWGKLTDDDLTVIAGKKDQLVGKVQERYGIAREAAEKQVDEFTPCLQFHRQHRNRSRRAAGQENRRRQPWPRPFRQQVLGRHQGCQGIASIRGSPPRASFFDLHPDVSGALRAGPSLKNLRFPCTILQGFVRPILYAFRCRQASARAHRPY
jgi:uncharacterized protein YjbJ (UPF0337 family)